MIWRLGDGRNLNIWSEWTRRPITPRGNNLLTAVDDLIDPATGDWDRELVEEIFWEEDAKLILALQLMKEGKIG